jgi:predicted RNA-binding Zn-ribbon protein involved in translation (DUF1610 family)
MVRLGDTYSALAENPVKARSGIFVPPAKYVDPMCGKCGKKMRLSQSLPRTEIMPAMQVFRCDGCGKTLIWKGERFSGAETGRHRADQSYRDSLCGDIIYAGGGRWPCPRTSG